MNLKRYRVLFQWAESSRALAQIQRKHGLHRWWCGSTVQTGGFELRSKGIWLAGTNEGVHRYNWVQGHLVL